MARILVVDDDHDAGEAISTFLRVAGHEVHFVPNGREALSYVLHKLPDVVLDAWLRAARDKAAPTRI